MFCNQCEQAAHGTGCTVRGVCGKNHEVASLHDLLTHALKGLALYAREANRLGLSDPEVNRFAAGAHFAVLTNTNYDPDRFERLIRRAVELRELTLQKVARAGGRVDFFDASATFRPAEDVEHLVKQGEEVGKFADHQADEDIQSLQQTVVYGVRGIAAYAYHATILGQEDPEVHNFLHEALAAICDRTFGLEEWVNMALRTGEVNLRAMELLDAGNTGTYGHPEPTEVPLGHKAGKAILVSGHDLKDIEEVLRQSEGKGIYVYTHGEVLASHGYPGLKKYSHFYGHFGTAWQNQRKQFPDFPGAILMTTNCLTEPQDVYRDNLFTTGPSGWPGVRHVDGPDFSPVIEKALELPGFDRDEVYDKVMVGFARNTLLSAADQILDAVRQGAVRHIFLVGGCDGAKPGRSYYTDFVEQTPEDTLVLTLACGKYRFFDKKLGSIGPFPRLLDVGQCNDAYSAIQVAVGLADALGCGVNDLPLSMVLSWYEQKAVAILLTLLHLGVKDIRLGPSLPAFVTPNVLDVLVKNFNIQPITTPERDLQDLLGAGG